MFRQTVTTVLSSGLTWMPVTGDGCSSRPRARPVALSESWRALSPTFFQAMRERGLAGCSGAGELRNRPGGEVPQPGSLFGPAGKQHLAVRAKGPDPSVGDRAADAGATSHVPQMETFLPHRRLGEQGRAGRVEGHFADNAWVQQGRAEG